MLDDEARLRLLQELNLDERDDALDAVAAVAAQICGTPMAAVTLVGHDEQVFVGSVGLGIGRSDLASSFCAIAMRSPDEALLVPDTHRDSRFASTSLVMGDPYIRSYAGVPLLAAERVPLGAVCVLSDHPHALSPPQLSALKALAAVTERCCTRAVPAGGRSAPWTRCRCYAKPKRHRGNSSARHSTSARTV